MANNKGKHFMKNMACATGIAAVATKAAFEIWDAWDFENDGRNNRWNGENGRRRENRWGDNAQGRRDY